MAISPVSTIAAANTAAEVAKSIPTPAPAAPATLKPDTVAISSAAHAAAKVGGDGDADPT